MRQAQSCKGTNPDHQENNHNLVHSTILLLLVLSQILVPLSNVHLLYTDTLSTSVPALPAESLVDTWDSLLSRSATDSRAASLLNRTSSLVSFSFSLNFSVRRPTICSNEGSMNSPKGLLGISSLEAGGGRSNFDLFNSSIERSSVCITKSSS